MDPCHSGHHCFSIRRKCFHSWRIWRAFRSTTGHDDFDQPGHRCCFCRVRCSDSRFFRVDVWWELATLITIMVLGHWLEMKAISQARGALDALAALLPDRVERVTDSGIEEVSLSELRVGDVVLVRPGSRVPADGTVLEGTADVDESMITGESRAVSKGPGAAVVAGTVAAGGSLRVQVTAVGEQTALSGIMRLVAAAQASGSRTQALADRAAALLFYVALASGILTLCLLVAGW